MLGTDSGALLLKRGLAALGVCALAILCLLVLRPFLAPILWAAILAYVTWPLYGRLRLPLGRHSSAAALLMTLLVLALAIVPLFWLLILMQHELVGAYRELTIYLSRGPHTLPAAVRDIPWLGAWLQEGLDRYTADPGALARELANGLQHWRGELAALLGGVTRNLGKLFITVVTLFFLYRDADVLVRQIQRVGRRFFDDRLDHSIRAAGSMTRAVVYGLLVTALAQGVIAGIGYWIFGLEAPALLGAMTALLSAVPLLGTALVWAPAAAGLIVAGHTWKGVLLLAWGVLLVHPTDNVLRPLLISSVTRAPFLLIMFGVLGGLIAFGLVGAFVGPVVLGVASALWLDWVAEEG